MFYFTDEFNYNKEILRTDKGDDNFNIINNYLVK